MRTAKTGPDLRLVGLGLRQSLVGLIVAASQPRPTR